MNNKHFFHLLLLLLFITINVYLFVSAPAPLLLNKEQKSYTYSVEDAFKVIAKLNDITRTFYTKEIVGNGKKVGLKFDEHWKDKAVEAGPLPALFLRETSAVIEKNTIPLGLFLGSDYPIARANLFEGIQAEKFKEIKNNQQPTFFYDEDTKRYIGMFPDFASAGACVSCHNDHPDTPKKDWMLNDIMGATTWSYPRDSLTTNELMGWIKIYKHGTLETYNKYLEAISTFQDNPKPKIAEKFPAEGFFLPTAEKLNDTLSDLTSKILIDEILTYVYFE